jgi:hypothetical protein
MRRVSTPPPVRERRVDHYCHGRALKQLPVRAGLDRSAGVVQGEAKALEHGVEPTEAIVWRRQVVNRHGEEIQIVAAAVTEAANSVSDWRRSYSAHVGAGYSGSRRNPMTPSPSSRSSLSTGSETMLSA